MAGSVNKVILIGNLGKDPETRADQNGGKIVNLTIATSETWNDKASGERKERTEWNRVVIFNDRIADVAERFLKKGAKVYVEGSLQTRKWTDQNGADRYSTEVVIGRFKGELTMLDSRGGGETPAEPRPTTPRAPRAEAGGLPLPPPGTSPGGRDLDDEIPFSPCWQ